jgi:hypothetical protein
VKRRVARREAAGLLSVWRWNRFKDGGVSLLAFHTRARARAAGYVSGGAAIAREVDGQSRVGSPL